MPPQLGTLPAPSTTLAVILGASEFPKARDVFSPAPAFMNSAHGFRDYLLDKDTFGLPVNQILDLFDCLYHSAEIDEQVRAFTNPATRPKGIRDIMVYYVGHGGFSGGKSDYFLAVRQTHPDNDLASSYAVRSLANTLKENGRDLRRYVIFDCCYSAAAYTEFMSGGPLAAAMVQVTEELPPGKGTALLCASGPKEPAKAPQGEKYTMFTGAMLEVLRARALDQTQEALSFNDLADLIKRRLRDKYDDGAVRPQIHFPHQPHGSIGELPFFPKMSPRPLADDARYSALEDALARLGKEQSALKSDIARLSENISFLNDKVPSKQLPELSSEAAEKLNMELREKPRSIAGTTISELEFRSIPFDVQDSLQYFEERMNSTAFWVLLGMVFCAGSWLVAAYPAVRFWTMLADALCVLYTAISIFAVARSSPEIAVPRGPDAWQHLEAVGKLRRSRPAHLLFGVNLERKPLVWITVIAFFNCVGIALSYLPVGIGRN